MLTQRYSDDLLKSFLIPRLEWQPFPKRTDRPAWESLPQAVRAAIVQRGERNIDFAWPTLPAVRFLDYARDGNRTRYEGLYHARRTALADLVMAECIEGDGRFLDQITNGIWCICEESFWGVPAHIGIQKAGPGLPDTTEPIVDLFAAETAALLAWTVYLAGNSLDQVSKQIVPRVEQEIDNRILIPLLERTDFWWMGFSGNRVNNWNPWIVSNWLATALIMERDAGRRQAAVYKAMQTLDYFLDPYPTDGGCDEGPSYWGRAGASLYDCLEWLHSATNGRIDIYEEPLIRNIGQFIYRVQIAGRYFINFADAPPMLLPSPGVCYGYGKRIGDPDLKALAAWSAEQQDLGLKGPVDSLGRRLPALFMMEEILATAPNPPLPRDVFLNVIEVFTARDRQGSTEGFFVAAKGGHNAESHNHNDVGQIVVSIDGQPVLVDAGVEAYTAKTFGPDRYTIWTMQSGFHTLPTVNGMQQAPGREFAARNVTWHADDEQACFSLDIAAAYPPDSGIRQWQRTVTLQRGRDLVIRDDYDCQAITGPTTFNVLTACRPAIIEPGRLRLDSRPLVDDRMSGAACLTYDAGRFEVVFERVAITDERLRNTWGDHLTRIVCMETKPRPTGQWSIRIEP